MNKTRIAWATHSWNPVHGCSAESEGCLNCYARRDRARWFNDHEFKVTYCPEKLEEPTRKRKPAVIFVCSNSDLFHPDISDEFIFEVWLNFIRSPQHIFLVLTKRAMRMQAWFKKQNERCEYPVLKNVWLGVTGENQARLEERAKILLDIPAARRFVSLEPLLGPIKIWNWLSHPALRNDVQQGIDWVIAGGESGPGARECREDWIRDIWTDCKEAAVPFFFKQTGARWTPVESNSPYKEAQAKTMREWWPTQREFPPEIKNIMDAQGVKS